MYVNLKTLSVKSGITVNDIVLELLRYHKIIFILCLFSL